MLSFYKMKEMVIGGGKKPESLLPLFYSGFNMAYLYRAYFKNNSVGRLLSFHVPDYLSSSENMLP